MKETLAEALSALFTEPGAAPAAPTAATGTPLAGAAADRARKALDRYNQAMERLKSGDWTGFGTELDAYQRYKVLKAGGIDRALPSLNRIRASWCGWMNYASPRRILIRIEDASVAYLHRRLKPLYVGGLHRREQEIDGCSFFTFAGNADMTADQPHECAYLRQPQAGAQLSLGREKRVKDPLQRFGRHSLTAVLDTYSDVNARQGQVLAGCPDLPSLRAYLKLTPVRHRIARIHDQIEDRGVEL
jgi:hypothetical protein